jgi:hypothetical protein
MFEPAVNEMIVGKSAQAQFKGLRVGDQVRNRNSNWTVVGVFESGGDSHQSEAFADAETLLSDGGGAFSSVTVMLESPAAFQKFKDDVTSNPALAVDVAKEREFYAKRSANITRVINVVAYVVGGIMAIGAIFGALNTMYSAVSARGVHSRSLKHFQTIPKLSGGSLECFCHANNVPAIQRFPGCDLLVMRKTDRRNAWHHKSKPGAIHARKPLALVPHDLAVLIDVHILAEVVNRFCGFVNREVVVRDFRKLSVGEFTFFDNSRLHAVDHLGLLQDGNHHLLVRPFQNDLVLRLENEIVVLAVGYEVVLIDLELGDETVWPLRAGEGYQYC